MTSTENPASTSIIVKIKNGSQGKPVNGEVSVIKNRNAADCSIRTFAYISDLSWEETYDLLYKVGKACYDVLNSEPVLRYILRHSGCKRHHRPNSVWELIKMSKGKTFVVFLSEHIFVIQDGKILDRNFFTPDKKLSYYFEVPKKIDLKKITEEIYRGKYDTKNN